MAGTKWTEDQIKVIEERDKNVLVSATAGSGKTAVLVERIISIVTGEGGNEPVDIDKLLVVTFTRAAAGEMKERILKALEKKSIEEPLNEHLRRQMTYIHGAKIATIDSFCSDVVKEHFSRISIDPGFSVGDTGELKLLRSDVVAKLLEDNYENADEGFLRFIDIYSDSKSDNNIENIILRLYDFAQSYPDPVEWLDSLSHSYEKGETDKWVKRIVDLIFDQLREYIKSMELAAKLCDEYGFGGYKEVIEKEYLKFDNILHKENYDEIGSLIKNFTYDRLPTMKNLSEDEELGKKQIQDIRNGYKKKVSKLADKYFLRKYEDISEDICKCKPVIDALVGLVKEFSATYKEAKSDKNLVDFSDLEHYALEILVKKNEAGEYAPTDVAKEMAADFYEVMIDEYQDSNLVQEIILTAVSGRGKNTNNLFMVGDVKQSIYKFRLARPELFLEKYNKYPVEEGGEARKIILSKNFRSRHQVIDFCNMIFEQIMTKPLGGIVYDEENMLYTGLSYPDSDSDRYKAEILFLNSKEEPADGIEAEDNLTNIELEAALCAKRIKELVYGGDGKEPLLVYDKETEGLRPITFSDIAILLRSMANSVDVYNQVLMAEGIPVDTTLSVGYFDAFEVSAILDLLSVIDNPRQDIKLVAVLRNIFGFTENMLADIRIGHDGSFYDAYVAYSGIYDVHVNDVKNKIASYRKLVSYTSIYDLICHIINDTHFKAFIMSGKAGVKRLANVEMLLEKAKSYENGPYSGLFNFVRYIDKLKKYNVEEGEASVVDGNSDAVKIMTIHKSKGLEYPVVFVSGMGKKMNMMDTSDKIVIHHEMGVGINYIDVDKRLRYKTFVKEAIGNQIKLENLAEELRVLYVALTRAREKLILTGVGNIDKKIENYAVLEKHKPTELLKSNIAGAATYMDWIMMAIARKDGSNLFTFRKVSQSEIILAKIADEVKKEDAKKALVQWDTSKIFDGNLRKAIEDTFAYRYDYEEECQIKSKMSISDIKHMFMKLESDESPAEVIDFGAKSTLDDEATNSVKSEHKNIDSAEGARRGTAYHRVFELIDYDKDICSEADVTSMMNNMIERGLIDKESARLVSPKKILSFLDTKLGKRMSNAHKEKNLYREKPFVMGIPAKDIYPDRYTSKELVVVQGIVDAWFIEDGEIVLVDYKTDGVKKLEDLKARYESQLVYYGEALEKITGLKIKQRLIYSVKFDSELEV